MASAHFGNYDFNTGLPDTTQVGTALPEADHIIAVDDFDEAVPRPMLQDGNVQFPPRGDMFMSSLDEHMAAVHMSSSDMAGVYMSAPDMASAHMASAMNPDAFPTEAVAVYKEPGLDYTDNVSTNFGQVSSNGLMHSVTVEPAHMQHDSLQNLAFYGPSGYYPQDAGYEGVSYGDPFDYQHAPTFESVSDQRGGNPVSVYPMVEAAVDNSEPRLIDDGSYSALPLDAQHREGAISGVEHDDGRPLTRDLDDLSESSNVGSVHAKSRSGLSPKKPRHNPKKQWVRVNKKTKANTRSAKILVGITAYAKETEHPLGEGWESPATGQRFKYNKWGELSEVQYSADQIMDFLQNHPFHRPDYMGPGRLILWINKVPGDSAGRSETKHSLHCRMKDCPCHVFGRRTITQGTYRVAFDEQWTTYGTTREPMYVAAYFHLYCLERFLDFREICRTFDVRADNREISKEPTGEWKSGLKTGTHEYNAAQNFIDLCRTGSCRHGDEAAEQTVIWPQYPPHNHITDDEIDKANKVATAERYAMAKALGTPEHSVPVDMTRVYHLKALQGAEKDVPSMLVCALSMAKVKMVGNGKMKMMEARNRTPTQFFVNKGDLQMQVNSQQEQAAVRRAKRATGAYAKPPPRLAGNKRVRRSRDDEVVDEDLLEDVGVDANDGSDSDDGDNNDEALDPSYRPVPKKPNTRKTR